MCRWFRAAVAITIVVAVGWAAAQDPVFATADDPSPERVSPLPPLTLTTPVVLPRLSPDLALATYEHRMRIQAERLAAYSDTTVMQAQLPETSQTAEYELRRRYSAPKTLEYTPVRFQGDPFVKSNIFLRLLQSEVDHVSRQQGADTAISQENYKFSLKAVEYLNGHLCYVFHIKPRKNRVGLFKGKVFFDTRTGTLRRAEGSIVRSPSWWVKKIEFVQEFDDVDGFNLPVHLHSVTKARVIGRAIVDVFHHDYRATAVQASTTVFGGGAKTD